MGHVIKKLVIGVVVGGALLGITKALDFPMVFQMLFFAYALLGAAVFILLDLPSLKPLNGVKALGALVVFYIILCVAYIAGATLWPQYDPEDEKGKIEKILKPKRAATEQGKAEELIARAKALDEQAKALAARIKALGGDQAPGRAEAALQRVVAPERLLQVGQRTALGERLHGLDSTSVDLDGEHAAAAHGHAVDEDRARAADAVLAPDVRPRQPEAVSEEVRQQHPRLDGLAHAAAVHGELDLHHAALRIARAASAPVSPRR